MLRRPRSPLTARPRTPPPTRRRSSQTSDVVKRAARYLLRHAVESYAEQRGHQSRSRDSGGSAASEDHHHHAAEAVGGVVTSVLVGELIKEIVEYIKRHRSRGQPTDENKATPTTPPSTRPPAPPETQHRQGPRSSRSSSRERRHRYRRRRARQRQEDNELLIRSLDGLSIQLQDTYDLVQRTIYARAPHDNCPLHDALIADADQLRGSLSHSMATIERVQHHHDRRVRERARRSRLSRSGTEQEATTQE